MNPGYTVVRHEILDSEAARLLSPAARGLLFDFLRKWSLATASGRTPAAIPFTWVSCAWLIARNTWGKGRGELTGKGFLLPIHVKTGDFAWCESWRTYQPTLAEMARLEKQRLAQQKRANATKAHRAQGLSHTPGRKNEAIPPQRNGGGRAQDLGHSTRDPVAQDLSHEQGARFEPRAGRKNEALLNSELQELPPPTPSRGKNGGGGVFTYSGGTVRFGSSTEVWCFWRQHGGDFTGEEWDRVVHVYQEFQAAEAKPAADSLDHALKSKNGDAAAIIARHLGDSSKRALDHISTIVSRYGLPAVVSAVKSLLSDGTPREKRLAFLDHRAKTANVPERDIEIARRVQRESA